MIYELFRQMADDMDRFLMLDQSNLVIRRAESLLDSAKMVRNRVNESFYEWVTTYFNYQVLLILTLLIILHLIGLTPHSTFVSLAEEDVCSYRRLAPETLPHLLRKNVYLQQGAQKCEW